MKAFLICVLLVACEGCQTKPLPPVVSPEPATDDAGAPLDDSARACRHLRALQCPDGNRTPGGISCEKVLRANVPPNGGVDAVCLRYVKTCDQEDTCTVSVR